MEPEKNFKNQSKNINHLQNQNHVSNKIILPILNENKKIFIHKPSDFLKNKYTFLGNLSNNNELLSLENKKTYHSPKFSMRDINIQIYRGNKVIDSILKEEIDQLPSLLKNYLQNKSNPRTDHLFILNQEKNIKIENNSFTKNKEDKNYIIQQNKNRNYLLNNPNLNNHKNLNEDLISTKREKLVKLNFFISSPKKKSPNKHYFKHNNISQNYGINENVNKRRKNHISIDNINDFMRNSRNSNSFQKYISSKIFKN